MNTVMIYAADIGSIKANHFGWAKRPSNSDRIESGTCIRRFAQSITDDLNDGLQVLVGFECPLF
jgi:hypothetical protein